MRVLIALFVGIVTLGFVLSQSALAGTVSTDTLGVAPLPDAGSDIGVSLSGATGCRLSVRATDGGTVNGGTLKAYYYDTATLSWNPSHSALDCTLDANRLSDAGAPYAQICPDLEPLGRYGRILGVSSSLVNGAGTAITATVRTECWGQTIGGGQP